MKTKDDEDCSNDNWVDALWIAAFVPLKFPPENPEVPIYLQDLV
jgi:hypothetical protein